MIMNVQNNNIVQNKLKQKYWFIQLHKKSNISNNSNIR